MLTVGSQSHGVVQLDLGSGGGMSHNEVQPSVVLAI